MIRISGLAIISRVAAVAEIRSIDIIAFVAGKAIAGNSSVRTLQQVILVMDRKSSRLPVGIGSMTGFTFVWNTDRIMIWVDRLVKISFMAG